MKKVLVIQHVRSEGLGTIGPELKKAGIGADFIKVFDNEDIPEKAGGYSALIVMGGPMGVYEEEAHPFIKDELNLIRNTLKEDLPVLGVCLGSQMLAKAAGAQVFKGKTKEIGWYNTALTEEGLKDRLFIGFPSEFTVFQWHGDTFGIPENSVNLATSRLFKNQVIRVGKRAYGLQFHLEVTEEMIRDWIRVNGEELKAVKDYIDPEAIIRETPSRITELKRFASALVSRFLRMIE